MTVRFLTASGKKSLFGGTGGVLALDVYHVYHYVPEDYAAFIALVSGIVGLLVYLGTSFRPYIVILIHSSL